MGRGSLPAWTCRPSLRGRNVARGDRALFAFWYWHLWQPVRRARAPDPRPQAAGRVIRMRKWFP